MSARCERAARSGGATVPIALLALCLARAASAEHSMTMLSEATTAPTHAGETTTALTYYDNCDGTVQAGEWTVKDAMWGVGYGLLSFITFVGNVINVCVFVSRRMPTTAFNSLLLSLAVAEGTVGGMFFVELSVATYGPADCNQKLLKAMAQVGDLATYAATWITALISVMRCVAVTAPIAYKKLCTVRHTYAGVGVCVAGLALMETAAWINIFVCRYDPDLLVLEPVRQTIGRFLPICIALASTATTIVRFHCRKVDGLLRGSADDATVIRMLLALLSVFFATNGYAAVSIILQSRSTIDFDSMQALLWSVPLAFGINSSCNIFLYFFMTPKYRAALAYYYAKATSLCLYRNRVIAHHSTDIPMAEASPNVICRRVQPLQNECFSATSFDA